MFDQVKLAWTVPVSAAALGARLEAYADTKAMIKTFELCVKYTQAPLKYFPPEIVLMIPSRIRDSAFLPHLEEWERAHRCLEGECGSLEHFSSDDLERY